MVDRTFTMRMYLDADAKFPAGQNVRFVERVDGTD
jgi:hypothetical protein